MFIDIHIWLSVWKLEAFESAIGSYRSLNLHSPSTLVNVYITLENIIIKENQHYYAKSQNTASSPLPCPLKWQSTQLINENHFVNLEMTASPPSQYRWSGKHQ